MAEEPRKIEVEIDGIEIENGTDIGVGILGLSILAFIAFLIFLFWGDPDIHSLLIRLLEARADYYE